MKQLHQASAPARSSSLFSKSVMAMAIVALLTLAGCAYTSTMNERNEEGERLRRDYEYEQARHERLSR